MVRLNACMNLELHSLLLALLTAVALNPATVIALIQDDGCEKDAYPPLWHQAHGSIEAFPAHSNKIIINAWNYEERLGVYKIMLNYSAKYFTAFGANNVGNILWGLPLQLGWQYRTAVNYYLAIIPFLGAMKAGFFGQLQHEIEILPPEERREDFCYSTADCHSRIPKLMDAWKSYFEYLLSTEQKSERPTASSFSTEKDEALHYLWEAHLVTTSYAVPKFRNRLKYTSSPEASFGENWASVVDFIAATHFPVDLQHTNYFQAFLPPRMLSEYDKALIVSDFSPEQNIVLFSFWALHKTNKLTGGILLLLWKMAMSTEAGRGVVQSLIETVTSWPGVRANVNTE